MNKILTTSIWRQFGAAIDMLENAINRCRQEFWDTERKFGYIAYHCLFWLDYYLTLEPSTFKPPAPFTLTEFEKGALPDRAYSKEELLTYLSFGRKKCYGLLSTMTDEISTSRWKNDHKDYPLIEILLYNMRHVQHHTAQLNLLLRQEINDAPGWISIAKVEID